MDYKDQVISLKLAEKLKAAGVSQKETVWVYHEGCLQMRHYYHDSDLLINPIVATYTTSELGERLPARVYVQGIPHYLRISREPDNERMWIINYETDQGWQKLKEIRHPLEAEARGLMLEFLMKEVWIRPNEN